MANVLIVAIMLCIGGTAGWFLHGSRSGLVLRESRGLTIEDIQQLASLTVLKVQMAEVKICELHGYTGGIQAVMAIQGDVEIAVDLAAARLENVDLVARHAVLVLPVPTANRPRVDHTHTRIYRIDRTGLWRIAPGETGEVDLLNRALQEAQKSIEAAGSQQSLIDRARQRTEEVLLGFGRALGWDLDVRWDDRMAARPLEPASAPPVHG